MVPSPPEWIRVFFVFSFLPLPLFPPAAVNPDFRTSTLHSFPLSRRVKDFPLPLSFNLPPETSSVVGIFALPLSVLSYF